MRQKRDSRGLICIRYIRHDTLTLFLQGVFQREGQVSACVAWHCEAQFVNHLGLPAQRKPLVDSWSVVVHSEQRESDMGSRR